MADADDRRRQVDATKPQAAVEGFAADGEQRRREVDVIELVAAEECTVGNGSNIIGAAIVDDGVGQHDVAAAWLRAFGWPDDSHLAVGDGENLQVEGVGIAGVDEGGAYSCTLRAQPRSSPEGKGDEEYGGEDGNGEGDGEELVAAVRLLEEVEIFVDRLKTVFFLLGGTAAGHFAKVLGQWACSVHLQQNPPQGIDVGSGIDVIRAVELFGRCKVSRKSDGTWTSIGITASEVNEAYVVVDRREHDVRRLQVEVEGLMPMQFLQGETKLLQELAQVVSLVEIVRMIAEKVGQRGSVDVVHDEAAFRRGVNELVVTDDVFRLQA